MMTMLKKLLERKISPASVRYYRTSLPSANNMNVKRIWRPITPPRVIRPLGLMNLDGPSVGGGRPIPTHIPVDNLLARPTDPKMELRLSVLRYRNNCTYMRCADYPRANFRPGILRIHYLSAGYRYGDWIVHTTQELDAENAEVAKKNQQLVRSMLKDVGKAYDITELNNMNVVWTHDGDSSTKWYWGRERLKHQNYSLNDVIPDYYETVYELGSPFFNGTTTDIRVMLESMGFHPGNYYEAEDLRQAFKDYYKADVYLVFVKNEIGIPVWHEVGFLHNVLKQLVSHPSCNMMYKGKFLFEAFDYEEVALVDCEVWVRHGGSTWSF